MERVLRNCLIAAVVFVAAMFAVVAFALADEPHKHRPQDRGLHAQFYKNWMMPDNRTMSCCSDQDCAPAQSKFENGKWYARQSDTEDWTEIPPHKIETERDSPDGRSHLCIYKSPNNAHVFCFLPAAGG